jgi:uncharacterized protein with FMN-binding domain
LRRALLTIGGTVAGLAALLSFKTHPMGVLASAAPQAPAAGSSSAAPPGAGNAQGAAVAQLAGRPDQGSTAKPGGTAKPSGGATAKAGTSAGGAGQGSGTRTVAGSVASTPYGPMQVAVTLTGKRITKVTVLRQTDVGGQSSQIDAMAIPQLTSEALTAQSASIDAVSGASYTSAGYKQSLQSALDKAGA